MIPKKWSDGSLPAVDLRNECGYLRLSLIANQTVGEASRTLGGIYERTNSKSLSCFPSIENLAELVRLPERTVQRHLHKLRDAQIIHITRRTNTSSIYHVRRREWQARGRFLALPRWWTDTRWAPSAVYACLLSRLCMSEELEESIGYGTLEDLHTIPRRDIRIQTGLTIRSINRALRYLADRNYIEYSTCPYDHELEIDLIEPACLMKDDSADLRLIG